jgi:hypothetical protein
MKLCIVARNAAQHEWSFGQSGDRIHQDYLVTSRLLLTKVGLRVAQYVDEVFLCYSAKTDLPGSAAQLSPASS